MNVWTKKEIETLNNNWTAPPDMVALRKLIGRSSASIYEHANKLGLPKLSYKETIAIKTKVTIADKKVVFLENYKIHRYEREALRKSAVAWSTVRLWIERDPDFSKSFKEIETYIASTKRCVYCKLVDSREVFRPESGIGSRNQWKTGVCKKCDSKRVMRKNGRSLESRLKTLWKSCKRSVCSKRTGRNTPSECTITPNDLMKMYESQGGRCHYTGLNMKYERTGVRDPDVVSVDRKNPKLGYFLENIVLCRWTVNQMKRDVPYDEFIELCKLVSMTIST